MTNEKNNTILIDFENILIDEKRGAIEIKDNTGEGTLTLSKFFASDGLKQIVITLELKTGEIDLLLSENIYNIAIQSLNKFNFVKC